MKTIAVFSFAADREGGVTNRLEYGFSELVHDEAYNDGWDKDRVSRVWDRCLVLLSRGYTSDLFVEDEETRGDVFVCVDRDTLRRQMLEWSRATRLPA